MPTRLVRGRSEPKICKGSLQRHRRRRRSSRCIFVLKKERAQDEAWLARMKNSAWKKRRGGRGKREDEEAGKSERAKAEVRMGKRSTSRTDAEETSAAVENRLMYRSDSIHAQLPIARAGTEEAHLPNTSHGSENELKFTRNDGENPARVKISLRLGLFENDLVKIALEEATQSKSEETDSSLKWRKCDISANCGVPSIDSRLVVVVTCDETYR